MLLPLRGIGAAAAVVVLAPGAPSAHAGPFGDAFTSPSQNIDCVISAPSSTTPVHPAMVRCDLRERTFTPPPRPADCGMGPWAKSVRLERGAAARFTCISDSVINADAVTLDYGRHLTAHDFDCRSARDGIRCTDTTTGRGFRLAADSYAFF
ncbi:hypothetical protein BHQ15_00085 [Mycolicibacillus koreensis]|nr:hypothetical protein BHQ15_00085 [Mycolicibacillus koreensis]